MVELTRRDALKAGKVTGAISLGVGGTIGGFAGLLDGMANIEEGSIRSNIQHAGKRIAADVNALDTERIEASEDGVFVEDYGLDSGYALGFEVNVPTDFSQYDSAMQAVEENAYLEEDGAAVFDAVVDGYSPILKNNELDKHIDEYAVRFDGPDGELTYVASLNELHGSITASDESLQPDDVYQKTLDDEHLWQGRNMHKKKYDL